MDRPILPRSDALSGGSPRLHESGGKKEVEGSNKGSEKEE